MARPQKEGLDYFPHDVYASSDEKIEPLILLYGAKGYAFYFLHLEYIYRHNNCELDISDAETREVICQKLHINSEEYQQILQTCLKKGCFDKKYFDETGKLTSNGAKKRASSVLEKREKMRIVYEELKKESNQRKKEIYKNKSKVKDLEHSCYISDAETKKKTEQKIHHDNALDAVKEVISFYNAHRRRMPEAKTLSDQRKSFVNARLDQYGFEKVKEVILKAEASDFLNGGGDKGWVADLDWIMRPNNFPHILEGKYDNRDKQDKTGFKPKEIYI